MTAVKLCYFLGISINTKFIDLAPHKLDLLNTLLSFYNKLVLRPFLFNHITDLAARGLFNENKKDSSSGIDSNLPRLFSLKNHLSLLYHTPILSNLNNFNNSNLLLLINLNTYRGRRYKLNYPVRGQRTRSNANTAYKLNRIKK